ncbi:MAG: HNH endonuclease [Cyanobacteria bacterium P01_H01_bin.74]
MILLVKGKAEAIEQKNKVVSICGLSQPLVIRLLYYVKIPHKSIPISRRNIMHRDNYACQYCGRQTELTIDHVIPRSKGGQNTWNNVVVACQRCNTLKGSKTIKESGLKLMNKPGCPYNFVLFELSKQHRYIGKADYACWRKYLYYDLESIG